MTGWDDLGDDELTARLVQRGVAGRDAVELVHDRDDPDTAQQIGRLLSR